MRVVGLEVLAVDQRTPITSVVHSPLDMGRIMPSAVRGTVAHGAFLPYQSGVSMAPGRNAARAIVDDLFGRQPPSSGST